MHRLTLDVQDNVLDKIFYFLNNLPTKEVKIIKDEITKAEQKTTKKLKSISIKTKDFKFNRNDANAR